MRDAPCLTTFIGEKLRASHVEDLPPVEPLGCVVFSIGFCQVEPYPGLAIIDLRQPVLFKI